MQLFYHPDIEPLSVLTAFSKEESRHLIRVLRKKRGDQIHITDGNGNLYRAEIIDDNDKKCEVQVLKSERKPDSITSCVFFSDATSIVITTCPIHVPICRNECVLKMRFPREQL